MPEHYAVTLFTGNWFLRNDNKINLTDAEKEFIVAAMGNEPLRWQAMPSTAGMKETLTQHPDVLERIGEPLLSVVVGMRGGGPAIRFLSQQGIRFKFDPTVYNVLHEAAWATAVDTLEAVFELGLADATPVSVKKPHTGWPDNLSLMYWAAFNGSPEMAELLIKYGASVHHELPIKGNGERGYTSLQEAAAPGHWGLDDKLRRFEKKREVARILIADGANYDAFAASGLSDEKQLESLQRDDAAVVSRADDFGMTPLHWAARAGAVSCGELLLGGGADVDALNRNKRTPLQLAAETNMVDIIRLLAQHGADLDTQDRKGRTPLHRATYEGSAAAAEALLGVGADPTMTNKTGKTAFEIARKDAKYFKRGLSD